MLRCVFKAITQAPLWNLPEGDDDNLPGWWSWGWREMWIGMDRANRLQLDVWREKTEEAEMPSGLCPE